MSLPVSSYEELLRTVRDLNQEARQVQRLASPLLAHLQQNATDKENEPGTSNLQTQQIQNSSKNPRLQDDDLSVTNKIHAMDISGGSKENKKLASSSSSLSSSAEVKNQESRTKNVGLLDEARFVGESSTSGPLSNLYHGTWPVDQTDGWQSGHSSLPSSSNHQDITSVMSFASSAGSNSSCDHLDGAVGKDESRNAIDIQHQLGAKVDIVYSLLSMLGSSENVDMGHTLFALSSSPDSCLAMRKSGCIPLLVQLVHSESCDKLTRQQASQALCNLVQAQPDDRLRKRELRVLKLLDQIRVHNETVEHEMHTQEDQVGDIEDDIEASAEPAEIVSANKHPVQIVANIMKLSFDEGHRVAICQLGGLQVIAKLVEIDYLAHGNRISRDNDEEEQCVLLRRYSGMALTNLTFGDSNNKALLCSLRGYMVALVRQLYTHSEDLKQVTASVLRNLSWRADTQSKQILREVGTVRGLAHAAMNSKKEATLKSILSALWNLSAHCSINKADICNVDGLLAFLVKMLSYDSPTKTLSIVENAGGILRNISSHIAVREDYREILRGHNCFHVLLDQLRSPSLTVVSNACGTLWNLSAKCTTDQQTLWDMGAVPMLRSLTHSKHKMISMGSSAALKNLLSARPPGSSLTRLDSTARALGLTPLPTLDMRKQRALEQELDENLSETCDNIEPNVSPTNEISSAPVIGGFFGRILPSHSYTQGMMMRKNDKSESRESVTSTHSDSIYEKVLRTKNFAIKSATKIPQNVTKKLSQSDTLTLNDGKSIKRYEQQRSLDSSLWKDSSPTISSHPASTSASFLRTKYSDCMEDDHVNVEDQPVDYSQKFAEKKDSSKTKVEVAYGNYAVTDLDQPTNYSLRYAEDDESNNKIFNSEFSHEDTIKTYCTEGTPYETPFNFSTATSMNDLRTLEHHPKPPNPKTSTNPKPNKEQETETLEEKETCSEEDVSKMNEQSNTFKSSHLSSGLNSPDKPVNYCEEGTPGYFSRVSSLSSLHSLSATNPTEISKLSPITSEDTVDKKEDHQEETSEASNPGGKREENRESKVVTFGNAVNYAEETPLMFSRSSSLASLGSVDQHSIHDDRSSIISDFSRRTSGVISPSELPDSPTQSVPPTPFPGESGHAAGAIPRCKRPPRVTTAKKVANVSVFEDTTSAFKDENTPIEFSRATSLSSLTIDDDVPAPKIHSTENSPPKVGPSALARKSLSPRTGTGIPRMRFGKSSPPKSITGVIESPNKLRSIDNHANMDAIQTYCTEDTPAVLSHAGSNSNLSELSFVTNDLKESKITVEESLDKVEEICEEEKNVEVCDAALSRVKAGVDDEEEVMSDVSSNTSADDRLLQICIQAGVDRVTNTSHTIVLTKSDGKVPVEDEDQIVFSDDSYTSADERLLQQCIQAGIARVALSSSSCIDEAKPAKPVPARRTGIPKFTKSTPSAEDKSSEEEKLVSDDNSADEKVLQDAIQLGMERVINGSADARLIHGGEDDDNASITSADERLLNECISCGIQAVTGQRPQIPSSFVQESQVHQHRKLSAPHANADSQKVPKRSRSLNFVQRKTSSQGYANEDLSHSNLKNKSSTERFLKSEMAKTGSTLSLESGVSLNDHERYLLDQCIRQGIERTTGEDVPIQIIRNQAEGETRPVKSQSGMEKDDSRSRLRGQYTRQNSQPATMSNRIPVYSRSSSLSSRARDEHYVPRDSELDSKNVQAPPVTATTVESLPVQTTPCKTPTNIPTYHQVTGVEENHESVGNVLQESAPPTPYHPTRSPRDTRVNLVDHSNPANFAIGATKNGSDTDESSSEMSDKYDYCKPRDPDSMIASVDRLTAELVSHASHLMKQSAHHDTLTESTSNSVADLTFPSISASVPIILSIENEPEVEKPDQNNFSSLDTNCSTLTDSTIIANEALKIANVVQNEGAMTQSCNSEQLDNQNPPSEMASLSDCGGDDGNSAASNDSRNRIKIKTRKISSNSILRRALNNSSFNGSYDNLPNGTSLNNSFNLDSVKPPSIMNDMSDMDNSMISVASITSEVVEIPSTSTSSATATNFIPNGLITTNYFDKRNNFLLSQSTDMYSNIENINPPSYFNNMSLNTITQNSLDFDQNTTCEDSDIFDTAADNTLQNEDDINDDLTTEYTDAQCLTPLQSDTGSSPEASPKKSPLKTKRLTPKQRRQLTKERYKTYTVTAEMFYRESGIVHSATYDQLNRVSSSSGLVNASDSGKGSSIDMKDTSDTMSDSSGKPSLDSQDMCDGNDRKMKLTPRQRRREDRSRFQTQTLDVSALPGHSDSLPTPGPSNAKASPRRTLKQKREEDRDRYRTQTIDDHMQESTSIIQNDSEMMLIQHGANLVMKTLLNSSVHNGDFLDCETLSLVSNDDEDAMSEHNSVNSENFRTYHKSWGFSSNFNAKLPIIDPPDEATVMVQDDGVSTSVIPKPKIVKPTRLAMAVTDEESSPTASPKAIRGRRKPLYVGASTPKKIPPAPPSAQVQKKPPLVAHKPSAPVKKKIPSRSPQSSPPARTPKIEPKKSPSSSPLRRQGTFVKEEPTVKSKIPQKLPAPRPASSPSRLPVAAVKKSLIKSSSVGETSAAYKRSPSETLIKRAEYNRSSSYSANKSTSKFAPSPQRSYSNSSIQNSRKIRPPTNVAPSTSTKEITSKIATLWKKIETNRTQAGDPKKDTRVWIASNPQPTATTSKVTTTSQLIRSSTFDSSPGKLKQIQT